jgi:RND family efflux transporter MFP subunit
VTVPVKEAPVQQCYTVAGEVILPPGQSVLVAAPISGAVSMVAEVRPGQSVRKDDLLLRIAPLLPVQRDLSANAMADIEAAETRLEAANLRAARAAKMLADGVGSVRAREDADEAVVLAETTLDAARTRLEQLKATPVDPEFSIEVRAPESGILATLSVGNGQMVSSGAPLAQVDSFDPLWIRVPVYAGDLSRLQTRAAAIIKPLNAPDREKGRSAAPVAAPPTADPLAATSDLYYRLANADMALRPGQKVSATLSLQGETVCLQAPYAALLHDVNGGPWVYEQIDQRVFARRRIMVSGIHGDSFCIAQGLEAGALVVTDAAAELFGTEFGGSH